VAASAPSSLEDGSPALELGPARPIPAWSLGCSVGCFVLVLIGLGIFLLGGAFFFGEMGDAADPDVQWPEIARYLPFDAPPADLRPELLMKFDNTVGDLWLMSATGERYLALFVGPPQEGLFEDGEGLSRIGMGGGYELEPGHVRLGGRRRACLRFQSTLAQESFFGASFSPQDGPSLLVDLSREDQQGILLRLTRSTRLEEPISDDELYELLAPFDLSD